MYYGYYPSSAQKNKQTQQKEEESIEVTSKYKIISAGGKETIVVRNCKLYAMVKQEKEFASEIWVWHIGSETWELAWTKYRGTILEPFWPGKH